MTSRHFLLLAGLIQVACSSEAPQRANATQSLSLSEWSAITLPWTSRIHHLVPVGRRSAFVATDSGLVWTDLHEGTAHIALSDVIAAGLGLGPDGLEVFDSAIGAVRYFDITEPTVPRETRRRQVGRWHQAARAPCGWVFAEPSDADISADVLQMGFGTTAEEVRVDWGHGGHLTALGIVLTGFDDGIVVTQRGAPYQSRLISCSGTVTDLRTVSDLLPVMALLDKNGSWVSLAMQYGANPGWLQPFADLESDVRVVAWWPEVDLPPRITRIDAPFGIVAIDGDLVWAVRDIGRPEIVIYQMAVYDE